MSQHELLKRIVDVLDDLGVGYVVTGSIVSSLQGEPRSTHDIDVVIAVTPTMARSVAATFDGPGFYVDPSSAERAARTGGMFNVVSEESGDKIDFWVLRSEEYDRARYERRIKVELLGIRFFVTTPEDTILSKLEWARRAGGSEKQVYDAGRVYEVQRGSLNEQYMDEWAVRLGVLDELTRIRRRAERFDSD